MSSRLCADAPCRSASRAADASGRRGSEITTVLRPKSFAIGDCVEDLSTKRRGRVVIMHPGAAGQRAYAWIERRCANGTVEREACWIEDLRRLDP